MLSVHDFNKDTLSYYVAKRLIENGYWTLFYIRDIDQQPAALLYEQGSEEPSAFAIEYVFRPAVGADYTYRKVNSPQEATHFILFTTEEQVEAKRLFEKYADLTVSDALLLEELELDGEDVPPASYIGILNRQAYVALEQRYGVPALTNLFRIIPVVEE